jgi:hypothetical protein
MQVAEHIMHGESLHRHVLLVTLIGGLGIFSVDVRCIHGAFSQDTNTSLVRIRASKALQAVPKCFS